MIFSPERPQQIMVEFLLRSWLAFCAVGMGIGKTAACIYAFLELKRRGEAKAMLIIAPLRVCNLTWPMEIKQWDNFKHLRVANLRTPLGCSAFLAGIADIYVINYEAIPKLAKLVERRGGKVPYDTVVYDESTRMKNAKAKRIIRLREDVPSVKRRWALTGTPAPNSLRDLWGQIRMLDDGERLGPSYANFIQTYFNEDKYAHKITEKEGTSEYIHDVISDITVTLRSSDWLKDVPDACVEDVDIHLGGALMEQYLEFEREMMLELRQGVELTAANAAALTSKLLQFTSGMVYDSERNKHSVHELKVEALRKILKTHRGEPVLVAVNFQHEQTRLRKAFPSARFFADATTPALQTHLLTQWNRREIPMLVVHPRSCGHGLNMQMGSNVLVWMTLTYSREEYEQTIARLVRRGQKEAVMIYRLMCPDTIDDVVATVLQAKKDTENNLLNALLMLEASRSGKEYVPRQRKPVVTHTTEEDWFGI